ncbi:cadmium-translocating P-type ATPase [candidate division KSB3 bacterium]|uniref:Cadmium-translocating P-type ATPase n=1 Tax=candidate division KSB3 bacterium TaxID=2044937 RepID=A0A9D5Q4Z5_9BACT|nr:cadmium-translocating P-type ATPase [candidate division KSB3 bacterium]MBD3324060.1 cadmium-translocating P-type ATPase [candidate division KSB3 bacterium]
MTQQKQQHQHNDHDGHHDHTEHHKMMIEDFKKRFYVSLVISIPVLLLSPMIQSFFHYSIQFSGNQILLFVLATAIFFYGGWPFLKGLYDELADKSPGMMTLIALAITVAYVYSSAVVFGLEGRLFFWELVTLIDIMLLGHWIEMRSVLGASNALEELAKLMPDTAHRMQDGDTEDVKISELQKGDIVLIKPGEKIPADGVIVKGSSALNESMLTGESKPVEKGKDDEVIGGSVNGEGSLQVEVKDTGEDSYLSQVINLVREAQAAKSKSQKLADRMAFWLTVIAITVGTVTLIAWLIARGDLAFAIERMATVMVITCPHALGLAVPLVVAVSTSLSAKNGLLIRNRTAFENARRITTVVFDKTGTLTVGEFGVSSVNVLDDQYEEARIVQLAASVEQNSEHPIASGIVAKANELERDLLEVNDFESFKGKGVQGTVDGQTVSVVSPGYLEEHDIEVKDEYFPEEPGTTVFVLINDSLAGVIHLADSIREESHEAINRLQQDGIKCWMLTGDNEATAKNVSKALKLDGYFAEILPDEKQDKVKELQGKGEFVAMTGDGVNDAPALAQADVGIAIGSGTDVAAETADIVLVNSNPQDVTSLILFGKATHKKMIQNFIWATGYNVVAIPLAAGVLYQWGIMISPALGAILMSLSTVIVAINAKLLRVDKEE